LYEASIVCYLTQGLRGNKLELILSKTKYGTPVATKKLLLSTSIDLNFYHHGIGCLKFIFRRGFDPNLKLLDKSICIDNQKYGVYWTPWTASLFYVAALIDAARPRGYFLIIVRDHLSHGADTTVVLVGYLGEASSLQALSHYNNGRLPDGIIYSGTFCIDLWQLLDVWKAAGIEHLDHLLLKPWGQSMTLWASKMRNSYGLLNGESKNGIERLNIDELGSKALAVLAVVPIQRLSKITVHNLEQTLKGQINSETFTIYC
jgi:hypothetical protein